MKIGIVYYSLYGHVHRLAEAVAEGVRDAGGEPVMRRVPETLPPEVIEKMGATEFQSEFAKIPVIGQKELGEFDAVFIGTPTRFGNMCGQMRQFLDSTGSIWAEGALVGKVGSVFTSTSTPHGGQESTILSTHITLLHLGMVIAGLPYAWPGLSVIDEVTGCSPYGASTITGPDNTREISENELTGARVQGRYVTTLARHLHPGREDVMGVFAP